MHSPPVFLALPAFKALTSRSLSDGGEKVLQTLPTSSAQQQASLWKHWPIGKAKQDSSRFQQLWVSVSLSICFRKLMTSEDADLASSDQCVCI